jgi:hypothetical protein
MNGGNFMTTRQRITQTTIGQKSLSIPMAHPWQGLSFLVEITGTMSCSDVQLRNCL